MKTKVKTEVVFITLNEEWLNMTFNTTPDKKYILNEGEIINDRWAYQLVNEHRFYKSHTTIKQWDEIVANWISWTFVCDLWKADEDGDRFVVFTGEMYIICSSIEKKEEEKQEEMTLEEVCEELWRDIKIVKK